MLKTYILIIENDTQNGKLLKDVLEAHNPDYRCHVFIAFEQARMMCAAYPNFYSLILLDKRLPDMSGLEGLGILKSVTNTPVGIITGDIDENEKQRAKTMGAAVYIYKPFKAEELVEKVRDLIEQPVVKTVKAPVVTTIPRWNKKQKTLFVGMIGTALAAAWSKLWEWITLWWQTRNK